MQIPDKKTEWKQIEDSLKLKPGEAHLWRARIPEISEEEFPDQTILDGVERDRVERFIFPKDKQEFAFSRGLLRRILAGYLRITPEKVTFQYREHGKPYLTQGPSFNLSHSHGVVVILVSQEGEVGVDVERIDDENEGEKLVQRYFSESEIHFFERFPQEQRREAFFKLWTLKEAFIKAKGKGLAYDLKDFSVQWDPQGRLSLTLPEQEGNQPWWPQLFQPYPDYQGAWVFGGKAPVLQCLDGNSWLSTH